MSSDLQALLEMGFPQNRAERALHATDYKDVQTAMDWLFAHEDDTEIDAPFVAPTVQTLGDQPSTATESTDIEMGQDNVGAARGVSDDSKEGGDNPEPQQATSLKCDECGKLLKSESEVQYHAAKSGHSNFSESTEAVKPLTDEEKQEQLIRLNEKLKQRRIEKEEKEQKEEINREKSRRVTGKDMSSSKQKFHDDEMRRAAEQRKREIMEDKLAREKIKAEIENDRRDRAARTAQAADPSLPATASASRPKPSSSAPPKSTTQKDYTQCRLQIRLPDGKALTHTFSVDASLQSVFDHIADARPDISTSFCLMTNFPKKVFSQDDLPKSLAVLDLVPSAVVIVTKSA